MKISVVMSTYNGQQYIEEQLESIYKQYRQPDQVLIIDDDSTDNTVELINKFIFNYKLLNWSVEVNRENIGWKRNFWRALSKSNGDIIFLADQDDIWYPNKIQRMMEVFASKDRISLLACGYDALYSDFNMERDLGAEAYQDTKSVIQITLRNRYFKGRAGCAFAVSRKLFNQVQRAYDYVVPHDEFLLNCSILDESCFELDEILLQHRKFANSVTSSIRKKKKVKDAQYLINRYQRNLERLNSWNNMLNKLLIMKIFPQNVDLIKEFIDANKLRLRLLKSNRLNVLIPVKIFLFNNKFYSKKTLLGDYLTDGKIDE